MRPSVGRAHEARNLSAQGGDGVARSSELLWQRDTGDR
jgi:hypothetical protein